MSIVSLLRYRYSQKEHKEQFTLVLESSLYLKEKEKENKFWSVGQTRGGGGDKVIVPHFDAHRSYLSRRLKTPFVRAGHTIVKQSVEQ